MDIVLHPKTEQSVSNQIMKPSHAVLIHAPAGFGKATLAKYLATALVKSDDIDKYPYFFQVKPENNSISIDSVRHITSLMSLKTIGTNPVRRVMIVEDAHLLTKEAQNALLKLLEEPPEDSVIILTADDKNSLLPTLVSRTRVIAIIQPERDRLIDYFTKKNFDSSETDKAYKLSDGRIGLMSSILNANTDHPIVQGIETAKKVLSLQSFERLSLIDDLSKDKEQLRILLQSLKRICRFMLLQTSTKDKEHGLAWHKRLTTVLQAENNLRNNAQPKLLLTNLFINL